MKGVRHYRSDSGFHCIRVHYSADPEKDPETNAGAQWFGRSIQGYPGGVKSSAWRQEMEIDWDSTGGELVFPQLSEYEEDIVIRPFTVPESWALYASFDFGHRNPSSFHVYAIDHDGDIWVIWEYYRAGVGYRKTAQSIRACPHWDAIQYMPIADPSIWAENQQNPNGGVDAPMKSIAQLFAELPESEQIFFAPGKKGGDITIAEKINGNLWEVPDIAARPHDWKFKPRLHIFATCPMMIWELRKIRYKDWSATMQEQRNIQEEIVDRDNHAFDDLKMFLTLFFTAPEQMKEPKFVKLKQIDPVSYEEWKRVDDMHRMGPKDGRGMGEFE